MECGICSRRFTKQHQPTCPSCARTVLYGPRLEQVGHLLAREKLHNRIRTILKPPSQLGSSEISTASQVVELTESSRKLEVESHRSQIQSINLRLEAVKEQQQLLKAQIAEAKKDNRAQKQKHIQDRTRITAARRKLQDERSAQFDQVAAESKRLNYRLSKVQKHTMEGRQKLCLETALLSGLNVKRRRRKDGTTSEDKYLIAGIPIPDLRELNSMHPDLINASLSHLTRLLTTTAHYLAIRLPAELNPPHASHPSPFILSLSSSYNKLKDGKIRYLSTPKPVPLLAKEDPGIYNNLIEGLVLFAYDIAWLSRSQGLTNIKTWEDLGCIGKNVHNLFFGAHLDAQTQPKDGDPCRLMFGEFSHASARADLNSAKASSVMERWEMPGLAKVQDQLKSHLSAEMSGAEWEVLDEKEWEEERDDERAVLVGGPRWSLNPAGGASRMGVSYMTAVATEDGERNGDERGQIGMGKETRATVEKEVKEKDKDESAKGWMKLKVRNSEG
ncbi:hypothetical protein B9Z65_1021 [Elsinoe australis]|uniref:Autophagy-related protein 14 n=1 Tax=Elsinoe australis TaxID=40998 RepID=A0A2P8AI31_9PEZI|nr:hypothetical protein B9Z65_1021 [Elsinoe australis]